MRKTARGITLVALVITIIILLILSTISIQALTSTGLFQNANKAKLEAKRGQIKEWLSLNLMEVQTTNYDKTDSEILEIAKKLLKIRIPIEQIIETTGLTKQEIEELN